MLQRAASSVARSDTKCVPIWQHYILPAFKVSDGNDCEGLAGHINNNSKREPGDHASWSRPGEHSGDCGSILFPCEAVAAHSSPARGGLCVFAMLETPPGFPFEDIKREDIEVGEVTYPVDLLCVKIRKSISTWGSL